MLPLMWHAVQLKAGTLDSREPADVATRLSFLPADDSFHRDGGPAQVGGLGGGWSEQRHHFGYRDQDRTVGFCACERLLLILSSSTICG